MADAALPQRKTSEVETEKRLGAWTSHDSALDTFREFTGHLTNNGMEPATADQTFGTELTMDPARETFPDHAEANALLTCEY